MVVVVDCERGADARDKCLEVREEDRSVDDKRLSASFGGDTRCAWTYCWISAFHRSRIVLDCVVLLLPVTTDVFSDTATNEGIKYTVSQRYVSTVARMTPTTLTLSTRGEFQDTQHFLLTPPPPPPAMQQPLMGSQIVRTFPPAKHNHRRP